MEFLLKPLGTVLYIGTSYFILDHIRVRIMNILSWFFEGIDLNSFKKIWEHIQSIVLMNKLIHLLICLKKPSN